MSGSAGFGQPRLQAVAMVTVAVVELFAGLRWSLLADRISQRPKPGIPDGGTYGDACQEGQGQPGDPPLCLAKRSHRE